MKIRKMNVANNLFTKKGKFNLLCAILGVYKINLFLIALLMHYNWARRIFSHYVFLSRSFIVVASILLAMYLVRFCERSIIWSALLVLSFLVVVGSYHVISVQ